MAEKQGEEMTPEERLTYLRDRGVMVETAEDRRIKEIRNIMKEPDEIINDDNNIQQNQQMNQEEISFVHIPTDDSIPMRELKFKVNSNDVAKGDLLLDYLKPFFSAMSKKVDLSLLQDQATKQFGTEGAPSVSQEALNKVAQQGQVESFTLVHPIPSNKFTGVNLYLDEVGMLKRLPRNKRGSDIALQAGFNPAPQFYGDLFIGRVKTKPTIKNANFNLGQDTSPDAEWLKRATMENLEYQTEMNRITGKNDQVQASIDGEDGIAKLEQGGLYSWTQTDEEIEVVVSVGIPSSMKEENMVVKKKRVYPQQHQSITNADYPSQNIDHPGSNDVMCGRGGGTNNHIGNIRFRQLVNGHKLRYLAATKSEKPMVAREVVTIWRNLNPPGRFLAQDKSEKGTNGAWNDVGDKKAREKASQCLRERTPDVIPFMKQLELQMNLEEKEKAASRAPTNIGSQNGGVTAAEVSQHLLQQQQAAAMSAHVALQANMPPSVLNSLNTNTKTNHPAQVIAQPNPYQQQQQQQQRYHPQPQQPQQQYHQPQVQQQQHQQANMQVNMISLQRDQLAKEIAMLKQQQAQLEMSLHKQQQPQISPMAPLPYVQQQVFSPSISSMASTDGIFHNKAESVSSTGRQTNMVSHSESYADHLPPFLPVDPLDHNDTNVVPDSTPSDRDSVGNSIPSAADLVNELGKASSTSSSHRNNGERSQPSTDKDVKKEDSPLLLEDYKKSIEDSPLLLEDYKKSIEDLMGASVASDASSARSELMETMSRSSWIKSIQMLDDVSMASNLIMGCGDSVITKNLMIPDDTTMASQSHMGKPLSEYEQGLHDSSTTLHIGNYSDDKFPGFDSGAPPRKSLAKDISERSFFSIASSSVEALVKEGLNSAPILEESSPAEMKKAATKLPPFTSKELESRGTIFVPLNSSNDNRPTLNSFYKSTRSQMSTTSDLTDMASWKGSFRSSTKGSSIRESKMSMSAKMRSQRSDISMMTESDMSEALGSIKLNSSRD